MSDIFLAVYRRDGAIQISMEDGTMGYRIAGPKFAGDSVLVKRAKLTPRDRDKIIEYLNKITDEEPP